jgi:hypothetical protein
MYRIMIVDRSIKLGIRESKMVKDLHYYKISIQILINN